MGVLGGTDIVELKTCLENVNMLEEQIRQLNSRISKLVNEEDVKRMSKVPGLGETSASAVIAEMGDPDRSKSRKETLKPALEEAIPLLRGG